MTMEDVSMATRTGECSEYEGEDCCSEWPNFCCGCELPSEEERTQMPKLENIAKGVDQLRKTADGIAKALDLLIHPKPLA
jgi:hypothetical protein